jgi:alpha-amylase/alpha-mannosidase (GH57 family)
VQRYICIHGHFYQPPRESPWLDAVETQDSAAPFHDWNERITAECYATNAAARILDDEGRIAQIVNNYARISFNFGPTLLSWMEQAAPDVYAAVLAADRESQERFSGHGSAMAQAFHHAILPLASPRDKRTEIRWGLADFRRRFGRDPEGMWLPEAAVDIESLDMMAEEGIRFAVLSPYQAAQVRLLGEREWTEARAGRIDTTRAYQQRLPSGRSIALFFYDGAVSRAVAFEGLLNRGEDLAGRLLGAFLPGDDAPQLVHIATDGETYGHHHRFGEMALAYALHYIESHGLARLTNYGEFLELHPPEHEVQIAEDSSWSCFHGIERWRSDCGCHTGGHAGWNQAWRAPLREALNWLRDEIDERFEEAATPIFSDPWAARDAYIDLISEHSPDAVKAFMASHAAPGTRPDPAAALRLMELQRFSLMMFTSCGWFFSEVSGIETVQVLQYAARALQLANQLFGGDLEPQFLARLREAPSNMPEYRDGAAVYERLVRPLVVDLAHVGAHYALTSLFEQYATRQELYCYRIERRDHRALAAGKIRLGLGAMTVTSLITGESAKLTYGALHLGAQTLLGGVREEDGAPDFAPTAQAVIAAFGRADMAEVIRLLSSYFGSLQYSLRSMFRDQQRAILATIMAATLAEVEQAYGDLYTQHAPLMRFLTDMDIPQPGEFHVAAAFTLSASLRRALETDDLRLESIQAILEEAHQAGVQLDTSSAAHVLQRSLDRVGGQARDQPTDPRRLQRFATAIAVAGALPFTIDLWAAQNIYQHLRVAVAPEQRARADQGDTRARRWMEIFSTIAEQLYFRVADDVVTT